MIIGPLGLLYVAILLGLPILATVVTLRRSDISLTNKILLIAFSWLPLLMVYSIFGLIGSILTLVIIYFHKLQEQH